jgi:metal-responsive CopG/Arc/MetJ family transcriptional regulator
MRVKTSITLDPETLAEIDRAAGERSRSELVEAAVLEYLERRRRAERDARDLEILNRVAPELDAFFVETLEWQTEP